MPRSSRSRSRSHSRGRSGGRRRSRSYSRSRSRSSSVEDGHRVHVADLGIDCSKRELERGFEKYGELLEVWLAKNPPCFAFIVFKHKEDAEEALSDMTGKTVCGNRIRCSMALPRSRGRRIRRGYDPNLRCYTCGDRGHFSRDCENSRGRIGGYGGYGGRFNSGGGGGGRGGFGGYGGGGGGGGYGGGGGGGGRSPSPYRRRAARYSRSRSRSPRRSSRRSPTRSRSRSRDKRSRRDSKRESKSPGSKILEMNQSNGDGKRSVSRSRSRSH